MRRLVFIDDDETELDDFGRIVGGEYDYNTIHWPRELQKLFSGAGPDIFVSDLYLLFAAKKWRQHPNRGRERRRSKGCKASGRAVLCVTRDHRNEHQPKARTNPGPCRIG